MSKKIKKKKIPWHQFIGVGVWMVIGGIGGFFMMEYMDQVVSSDRSLGAEILSLAALFVSLYAAMVVHLIIHEAGHLVFGLLTGYKFSSFRIMSFMWIKDGGKIRVKRYSLAGTGGQCLMSPPDLVDGEMPFMLYNLGGSLMNVIASSVFLILWVLFRSNPFWKILWLLFTLIGLVLAITNGVPMRMGTVNNDGYNALSLSRNKAAVRSFWIQMKIAEEISKGSRVKEMPKEWFEVPADEDMKNSMVAVVGVFSCNRLMDEQRFEEARERMEHLMSIESGIVDLHRNLMMCDRMYCELISQNRQEMLENMYTKEQKKFMKQMKTFPTVIRTEYVYALLHERDETKAKEIRERFEKCAKTYPYPNDIQSEREMMDIAEGIRYELSGSVSMETMKEIVDSME